MNRTRTELCVLRMSRCARDLVYVQQGAHLARWVWATRTVISLCSLWTFLDNFGQYPRQLGLGCGLDGRCGDHICPLGGRGPHEYGVGQCGWTASVYCE
jgi:hypothetical protein